MTNDPINNPSHYTQGIECIDYVESHNMDFCQGNAIKYLTRYKHKNGLEDLKKAAWYVARLIKQEEAKKQNVNYPGIPVEPIGRNVINKIKDGVMLLKNKQKQK